jgi:CHASE3 domain sensor protein
MNSEPVSVEALEDDVDRIRHNIGEMIRELDHRRRRAFDLKLQFQQHALRMVLVGAAVIALCAGAIALAVSRRRSRRSLGARAA